MMKTLIQEKLIVLQQQFEVEILYACESGSRAWGFASSDSDYDVRFIYRSHQSEYLSIRDRRDVIELPFDEVLDIGGWDLRKVLRLFIKSNAALYEWLQSPIVYMVQDDFVEELRSLIPAYFSGRAACHHYMSIAGNTFWQELQTDLVRVKKYFYALRPLLAALWIIEKTEVPPLEFHVLRSLIADAEWQRIVDDLLQQKKQGTEKDLIRAVPLLQEWIKDTLAHVKQKAYDLHPKSNDHRLLDQVFRKYISNDF
jgi:hypothetical protein